MILSVLFSFQIIMSINSVTRNHMSKNGVNTSSDRMTICNLVDCRRIAIGLILMLLVSLILIFPYYVAPEPSVFSLLWICSIPTFIILYSLYLALFIWWNGAIGWWFSHNKAWMTYLANDNLEVLGLFLFYIARKTNVRKLL